MVALPGAWAASAARRPSARRAGHATSGAGEEKSRPCASLRCVRVCGERGRREGASPAPPSPLPLRYMTPPAAGAARRGISRGGMAGGQPSGAAGRAHGGHRAGSLLPPHTAGPSAPPGSPPPGTGG